MRGIMDSGSRKVESGKVEEDWRDAKAKPSATTEQRTRKSMLVRKAQRDDGKEKDRGEHKTCVVEG